MRIVPNSTLQTEERESETRTIPTTAQFSVSSSPFAPSARFLIVLLLYLASSPLLLLLVSNNLILLSAILGLTAEVRHNLAEGEVEPAVDGIA